MDPAEQTGRVHLPPDEEELVEASSSEDDSQDTVSVSPHEPGRMTADELPGTLKEHPERPTSESRSARRLRDLLRRTLRGGSDHHVEDHDSAFLEPESARGEAEAYYDERQSFSTNASLQARSAAAVPNTPSIAPTRLLGPAPAPVSHALTGWPLGPASLKPGFLPTIFALISAARGDDRYCDDTAERYELLRRFDTFINKGLSGIMSKIALRKWEREAIREEMEELLWRVKEKGTPNAFE